MPLLDHFCPPLSERRHWHSFHNSWATYISSQLNALLPEGYFPRYLAHTGHDRPAVADAAPLAEGGLCLPVELEATYERTCVEQRVQPAA